MIYRVRHTTTYAYAEPVDLATHMLHLTPRTTPCQEVISARIVARPAPSSIRQGEDHFGNRVTWLSVDVPHATFEVTTEAEVSVSFPLPPPAEQTPPWEEVAAAARAGGPGAWDAAEFSFDSLLASSGPEAQAYAGPSFAPGRPILAALVDLNARFGRDFTFRTGVTNISTPVVQVLNQRAGVCQDFTHVMIAGLRSHGIPARYVSGYIRTRPRPGQPRRRGADQSHAWVSAWMGPAHGWVDLDPTNDVIVSDEHVMLGWGRDFADISPVRGVILGGGPHGVSVGVDLEPLEAG